MGGAVYAPTPTWVNGHPAIELREPSGELHRVLILTLDDEAVTSIYAYSPR